MSLKITTGKIVRPVKTVIYGTEGVGKSTLAAAFPEPLFIDVEGGTSQLDVRRVDASGTWMEVLGVVTEVLRDPSVCRTLVLDTADAAESLCIRHILQKYNQKSIEAFGYGKGYTYIGEEWQSLMATLDKVIDAGIHVVLIAHARQRKIELPDQAGAFDHWEMKVSRQVAPLLKEWADLLLFCNYKTFVVTTDKHSKKAQGGKRVMYTSHNPVYDAKNRYGLPEEIDLSFEGLKGIFGETKKRVSENTTPSPLSRLRELMAEAQIEDYQVREIICEKNGFTPEAPLEDYPDKVIAGCVRYFGKLANQIKRE